MEKRTGVVVPISALYTKDCVAVGDFLALKDFADFCSEAGLSVIQILPVNDSGTHSSPYSGLSAFALHPLYIRIEALPEFKDAFEHNKNFACQYKNFVKKNKYSKRFNYTEVLNEKITLLHLIYNHIEKILEADEKKLESALNNIDLNKNEENSYSIKFKDELNKFTAQNKWIIPYAVFKNLKDTFMQSSWKQWEKNFSLMKSSEITLRWNNKALRSSHNFFVWCQMRASEQFKESADYLRSKNIILKGDIPILMNEDSVDCWSKPEFFNQEERAGSPPDGENPLGQNWGFPTYNWERIAFDEYKWWKERVRIASNYYSAFRIDHILGFFRVWAVNEKESTAYLGHTIPYETFSRADLEKLGFDDGRLAWLCKPHIPTSLIEDITWNHEEAEKVLETVCTRVKSEELWNFSDAIKGDRDIYSKKFFDDEAKDLRVKNALVQKWRDRALLEIEKDKFVPVYAFRNSTAWKSLSEEEKEKLLSLFENLSQKENVLWKQNALESLVPIVNSTGMTACAEDLGANIECMSEVLEKLQILSLKVVRWCREWQNQNQPFISFKDYPERSVCTTSVHDSCTLRQWWNEEKQSVEHFIKICEEENLHPFKKSENSFQKNSQKLQGELFDEEIEIEVCEKGNSLEEQNFNADIADFVLQNCAESSSAWFINPLQDYLFLEQKYYLPNPQDERINVPGSVNEFNWTYRIPVKIQELKANKNLIQKIKNIAFIHDKNQKDSKISKKSGGKK